MQFNLPSNLKKELIAYDPKLKSLAKEQAPKKTSKKPKYPLGNIPHLIPHDIVSSTEQQTAIDHINSELVPGRFRLFKKRVHVLDAEDTMVPFAILYHYEQCWYAAWLPQNDEDYIYSYAYAFKNTSTAAKQIPAHLWDTKEICTEHNIGRGAQVFTYAQKITKQDIVNGYNSFNWRAMGIASYHQKSRNILQAIIQFESQLKLTIPCWTDTTGIFDRLGCANIFQALDMPSYLIDAIADKVDYQLTVDNLIETFTNIRHTCNYAYSTCSNIVTIKNIITTPYIKKRLQSMLDRSVHTYNDPENTRRTNIKYGYLEFQQTCDSIYFINKIWPECPVDYYRNYFDELRSICIIQIRTDHLLIKWLRENMPVASFFNILRKFYEKNLLDSTQSINYYDYPVKNFFELHDTFSMIMRILDADKELEAPKRWRMPDFHDYVQAEAWKVNNRKESLHQDLFPQPIKVNVNGSDWTFFQPMDTHQLAQWGQAVRNCVGSASRYSEDIRKRKHFIVLCMIDGKPTFTIQLDVSMGVMNVVQISGVANRRLADEQHEQYLTAFGQALQAREHELVSGS